MNQLLTWATILFLGSNTYGQGITFSPELGICITDLRGEKLFERQNKMGLKAGMNVNIPAGDGFFIQPGIYYHSKGIQNHGKKTLTDPKITLNLDYLEVPINLVYKYNVGKAGSVFGGVGPYFAFGIGGKAKLDFGDASQNEEENITFGNEEGDLKSLDLGVNVGIGYETPFGVYFRLQFGRGFTNTANDDIVKLSNQSIQFSLGYNIKRGKIPVQ